MDERRAWRAAPSTLALVWVFIGVAIAALPLLAITLWIRGGDRVISGALLGLTVVAVGYAWRFGLHPRLAVVGDDLVIHNPLRTRTVPLTAVVTVEPGENGLRISTDDAQHEVWCIQTSSAAVRQHRRGRADQVIDELWPYLQAAAVVPAVPVVQAEPGPERSDDPDDGLDPDGPELLIHRATHADADTLTELEQRASEAGLAHVFPPAQHPYPVAEVTARWHERLADRSVRVRLAELDGEPVGYLAYRGDRILHLGILPSQQRHGFGRELLDYATTEILRGHDQVTLWVLRDNVSARGFYRAYGFVDTDQERLCEFPPQPIEVRMLLTSPR